MQYKGMLMNRISLTLSGYFARDVHLFYAMLAKGNQDEDVQTRKLPLGGIEYREQLKTMNNQDRNSHQITFSLILCCF